MREECTAARKEANRLRQRIKNLQDGLRGTAQYYDEKAEVEEHLQEESSFWSGRADACEDFIDDLAKLLEGE